MHPGMIKLPETPNPRQAEIDDINEKKKRFIAGEDFPPEVVVKFGPLTLLTRSVGDLLDICRSLDEERKKLTAAVESLTEKVRDLERLHESEDSYRREQAERGG